MTAKLYKRLVDVAAEVGKLAKDGKNKFQNYNYVSIDTYYDAVGSVAAQHGVLWKVRELGSEHIGTETERGGQAPVHLFRYAFDVYTADGEVVTDFATVSVPHVIRGPQTAGSVLSYAEKVFMRTTFKVVTGEDDGDAQPAAQSIKTEAPKREATVKAEPAPKKGVKPEEWLTVKSVMELGMTKALEGNNPDEALKDLRTLWRDNKQILDQMQVEAPDVFKDIKFKFTEHSESVKALIADQGN